MIVAIIVLVLLSAYFSATETAFTSVSRVKIKTIAQDGDSRAEKVLKLSDNYDKLLTTILIGNNIVNIVITVLATLMFVELCGDVGATVATIFTTVVVLVFGEITPKTLSKEAPEAFSLFAAGSIRVIMIILTPISIIFAGWKKLLDKIIKVDSRQAYTEEELKTIVEEAETEGTLVADQKELIQNAIEFYELTAEEVMTPRPDIKAIDITFTEEEIAEFFKETGFSRAPVYEEDLDKILGVLNQKDFHNEISGYEGSQGHCVEDFVMPVVFVAETIKIHTLLKRMQSMKSHIAIVVDEYGGTAGLVTMEDIIEELVGEIYDEHDAIMSKDMTELANGSYRVLCNASITKVMDYFGIEEDFDVNTVNGWVCMCLGKLPERDDKFETTIKDKRFKGRVTKATARKALEINLMVEEIPDESEE